MRLFWDYSELLVMEGEVVFWDFCFVIIKFCICRFYFLCWYMLLVFVVLVGLGLICVLV